MFSAMYVSQFELKYVDIAVKFGLGQHRTMT